LVSIIVSEYVPVNEYVDNAGYIPRYMKLGTLFWTASICLNGNFEVSFFQINTIGRRIFNRNVPFKRYVHALTPGLPDFSWYNIPKRGKYTI
jgi:hypothetical protein